MTRSAKPKASNISIVRQAMPSAWPIRRRLDFCSTMRVVMSGNAASCAARVRPVGAAADNQDIEMREEPVRDAVRLVPDIGFGDIRVAGLEPVEMELHLVLAACEGAVGTSDRHFGIFR